MKNRTFELPKTTVYIVDDDPSVRDALGCLLDANGYPVESFSSAEDFLKFASADQYGCVLLDLKLPGMGGMRVYSEMQERRIDMPVIILTAYANVPTAVSALKAGVIDFIEKPFDADDLLQRVGDAMQRSLSIADKRWERTAASKRVKTLTEREREVFDRLASGQWIKQIANDLGTSPHTVKNQRTRILQKMEAKTMADLVRMAVAINGAQAAESAASETD